MHCTTCGSLLNPATRFCQSCGARILPTAQEIALPAPMIRRRPGRSGLAILAIGAAIAAVVVVIVVNPFTSSDEGDISPGETVSGQLTIDDSQSSTRGFGYYTDTYALTRPAGEHIAIQLNSDSFDAFLQLIDPDGVVVMSDDDGGFDTNSRIPANSGYYTISKSGNYMIEVSSLGSGYTGSYSLTLTTDSLAAGNNDAFEPSGIQVGGSVTVLNSSGDSIRLRVTPSMTAVTFATVSNGSSAVITAGPTTAKGYTWYEIETSEGTGWTRVDFLQP